MNSRHETSPPGLLASLALPRPAALRKPLRLRTEATDPWVGGIPSPGRQFILKLDYAFR